MERIQDYFANGGLFNPEMMDHTRVQKLILACRSELESLNEHLKINVTERERLRARNAELEREARLNGKRLGAMVQLIWESRWVSEEHVYQELVATAAEIRSGNFDGIDRHITK